MNRFVISYVLIVVLFLVFSYFFVDQNFFYLKRIYTGFAFTNRGLTTLFYILLVSTFFFLYSNILKTIGEVKIQSLKMLIAVVVLISLFSYSAMLSADIFNYTTTAKTLFKYQENPYIIMPIEFIGDTNLLFTHAANKIALYGPLWIVLSGVPYFLSFGNFLLSLFNFKLFIAGFYIATVLLIRKISKSDYSTVLFALNPLIVIEALISNHNDILMMFLALSSFFFLKKKKIFLSLIFILSSILIKYATVFLIPVYFFAVYKVWSRKNINWDNIYFFSAISMFLIFLLSAFRVEIYPWYGVWFLTFVSLIPQRRTLLLIALSLSFGLLLRYIPFMVLGTHFGITPFIRTLVTFTPVLLVLFYILIFKNLKLQNSRK